MGSNYLFTSESVSEGHPDKVADQISDAVLDAILEQDPYGRVAAETLCATGLVVLAGEITTSAQVDYIGVTRDTLRQIGYDNTEYGIDHRGRSVLGGYDKQSTYEEWIQAFDGKVRFLVLIGDTKEKIAKAARSVGFNDIIMADNLKEAVQICHDKANAGDAVLLSPACASWDQFKSYEQRGELFKEYVRAL